MKIVIAGGTGFIGTPLTRRLVADGHQVSVLTREASSSTPGTAVVWDPRQGEGRWTSFVAEADAVINLAGANIGEGRWTTSRKRVLTESRLSATNALVAAMQTKPSRTRVFISASAVGYYGSRDDAPLDERAAGGDGFLAELTQKWEAAARRADGISRLVILRFGVVLDADGGALSKMMMPFRFGAGGPVGSGQQWLSWIHRDDAVNMVRWAITSDVRGVFNATAPEPVRNRDFSKSLGQAMHRPSFMPAPAFALRAALGEMADMLLTGQRVVPAAAIGGGFVFVHPEVGEALASIVTK